MTWRFIIYPEPRAHPIMAIPIAHVFSLFRDAMYQLDTAVVTYRFKGVGLRNGRQLYVQCLLKYIVICAFENPPSIPSFLITQIVYIGYGQFKKMTPFPFTFLELCYLSLYILLLLITLCYYYMRIATN
jgi:hypothetical protein